MSDLVKRLRDYSRDDHERGCQGRYYDCSCGYDSKRDPLLEEAAARIEQLEKALDKMKRSRDRYRQAWEAEKTRAALEDKPAGARQ